MKDAIVRMLSSAKFWTAIIALISVFAAKYGFEISTEMTGLMAAIFAVLLGGQGLTDHGKAAALINNTHMVHLTPVEPAPAVAPVAEEKAAS
jgi:hypothetical protein